MSADIRLYGPFNKQFKLECYHCGKEITNLNNVSEGHEKCIEDQNDHDIDKENWVMRIDWDFTTTNKELSEKNVVNRVARKPKYSNQLIDEYNDICKVGFRGIIEDFIDYKNGKR